MPWRSYMRENDIIQILHAQFPKYIGDDAAVLPYSSQEVQLISKDLLVEDIHFRKDYFTPQDLAHKALHANLSDIAAMGARARFVLCGIAIPKAAEAYAQGFLEALSNFCQALGLSLVGGDTSASPNALCISITVIGYGQETQLKYRHTAQADDIIAVVGNLGWARLGLFALEQNHPIDACFQDACLRPEAEIKMGTWLGQQNDVTSMMDVSDGLYTDLGRLAKASKLQATIMLETLLVSDKFQQACQSLGQDPHKTVLSGGEDYALLCTVRPKAWTAITKAAPKSLYRIGSMQTGRGLRMTEQGQVKTPDLAPFHHFE